MHKHFLLFFSMILMVLLMRYAFNSQKKEYTIHVLPSSYSVIKLDDNYKLIKDTLSLAYHYPQIEKFIFTPKKQVTLEGPLVRNDSSFLNYYRSYLYSSDTQAVYIGNIAYGMYYVSMNRGKVALQYLPGILYKINQDSLNYWTAKAYALNGNFSSAYGLFKLCLQSNYQPDSCKKYIMMASLKSGDLKLAYDIINKYPGVDMYLHEHERLQILKANMSPLKFFINSLSIEAQKFHFYAALFVALIWLGMLLSLNIFDAKLYGPILLVLILSILSTLFLTEFLYRVYGDDFIKADRSDLLFYCIVVIGVVEELVKALPFLVAILLVRPKDSMTLLLMASVSGLAFSFLENIMYIGRYGIESVSIRGFNPTMLHIILTSNFAVAITYSRWVKSKFTLLWIIAAFLFSAILHGLYDYFLYLNSGGQFQSIANLSYLISLILVGLFGFFVANSLSISRHFSYQKSLNLNFRLYIFLGGLFAIEMFEYANVLYYTGIEKADMWLVLNVVKIIFTVYLIAYLITYKDLVKGRWSIFNAIPFQNNTILNKIFSGRATLIIGEKEYPLILLERFSDKENKSQYIKLQNIGLSDFKEKDLVLHFEKVYSHIFRSTESAILGYFNNAGNYIKIKYVKVKVDEFHSQ
ncbi:MAG TPA: PrsW family glutamic-type intramembrane protease [Cytophagaceae bacterium]